MTEKKKAYSTPVVSLTEFETQEIITVSGDVQDKNPILVAPEGIVLDEWF